MALMEVTLPWACTVVSHCLVCGQSSCHGAVRSWSMPRHHCVGLAQHHPDDVSGAVSVAHAAHWRSGRAVDHTANGVVNSCSHIMLSDAVTPDSGRDPLGGAPGGANEHGCGHSGCRCRCRCVSLAGSLTLAANHSSSGRLPYYMSLLTKHAYVP
jgi:hypothetical protein